MNGRGGNNSQGTIRPEDADRDLANDVGGGDKSAKSGRANTASMDNGYSTEAVRSSNTRCFGNASNLVINSGSVSSTNTGVDNGGVDNSFSNPVQREHIVVQRPQYAVPFVRQAGSLRVIPERTFVYSKRCSAEVYDPIYKPFMHKNLTQTQKFRVVIPYVLLLFLFFPLFYVILSSVFQIEWPVVCVTWMSELIEEYMFD